MEKLIQKLLDKKGYLKKSPKYIAELFNCTEAEAWTALKAAKGSIKHTEIVETISKPNIERSALVEAKNSLREEAGVYWVTGCAHAPWQNKAMYESTFNFLSKEVDLTGVILAGDCVDLNSLSSHDRGKVPIKEVTLDWEYKESNKFLDQIQDATSKVKSRDYLYGNHEDRYLRSMKDIDTSKYGSALLSPEDALNLEGRGYTVYNNWKDHSIQLGHYLDVCHGEFLNVHSAKKTIDTYRKSTLYFHTHRYQVYMEGLVAGWNMGAGADFNSPVFGYATRAMKTSWVNSSCLVTLDKSGYYHVQPLIFMKNKLIVNGREY